MNKISAHEMSKSMAGWHSVAPSRGLERRQLASACGRKTCFLRPKNLGYPVCAAVGKSGGRPCQPQRRGVVSAKTRAAQQHNQKIVRKADGLLKKL